MQSWISRHEIHEKLSNSQVWDFDLSGRRTLRKQPPNGNHGGGNIKETGVMDLGGWRSWMWRFLL
jgi:hypothetical protein